LWSTAGTPAFSRDSATFASSPAGPAIGGCTSDLSDAADEVAALAETLGRQRVFGSSWPETPESTSRRTTEPRIVRHVSPLGVGGALGTGLLLVDTPLVFAAVDDESFGSARMPEAVEAIDHVDIACRCRSVGPTPLLVAAIDRTTSCRQAAPCGHSGRSGS